MCGIAGIWNLNGTPSSTEELRLMLTVQHHRGPEGAAYTSMNDSRVLLGFLQLGFTDNQLGMQPLFNEDGTIALVYNGEIYDYEEIRKDLTKRGHTFRTQSDSEVLIHLYEEYGEEFVHRINGEFAFALYDDRKKQLLLVRDPFGIKPLTYHFNGRKFLFSSESKGIAVTENFQRELNPEYLASVAIGIPNTRITFFKNIENVRPGHFLIVNKEGIKTRAYWKPDFSKTGDTFSEAKDKVRVLLKNAVSRRLKGDVPMGISLSSGLDSTIIAGLVSELGYDKPTFSLGFTGRSFDESSVAESTSRFFGLKFNRVEVSLNDIAADFKTSLWHSENTTNSLSNTARLLTNRAVRASHLKALMGGESGDEIFGGYPYFVLEGIWRRELEGDVVAKELFNSFKRNEKDSHRIFWDQPKGRKTKTCPYPHCNLAYFRAKSAGIYSKWLWTNEVRTGTHRNTAEELFLEEVPPPTCLDLSGFDSTRLISRSIASTFVFPGLGDRLEMGNSLEGRVPFLDKDLVNYAYSLPEHYFLDMKNLKGKHVLREAFSGLLPQHFKAPAKHTFMAPAFRELFKTKSGKELRDQYLNPTRLKQSGIINPMTFLLYSKLTGIIPKNSTSHLFLDSLLGLFLSVQVLDDLFIKNHPLQRVHGHVLEMKEHFPVSSIHEKQKTIHLRETDSY